MGEEQKKTEEPKQPEVEDKKEEKTEEPQKTEQEQKPAEENKEEKKTEEPPKETAPPPPPLPPLPQEIVLKVYMHCEGCARKVRRCLKGFQGVEQVQTDCKNHTVVVKGDKADPLKVLERVQKKSSRKVELLSPIPPPPPPAEQPAPAKEVPKTEDKVEEPEKSTVVVSVQMHCEACAQAIRKRIFRMKGVESVDADLKNSLVKVEGAIDAQTLVEFIYKKTSKQAKVVKVEPHNKKEKEKAGEEKTEEGKEKKGNEGKKEEGAGNGGAEDGEKEKKEGGDDNNDKHDVEKPPNGDAPPPPKPQAIAMPQEGPLVELRRNEAFYYPAQNYYHPPPQQNYFYQQQPHQQADYYYQPPPYYPQRYGQEMYGHPPQMFSDENPNACSLM